MSKNKLTIFAFIILGLALAAIYGTVEKKQKKLFDPCESNDKSGMTIIERLDCGFQE